ncbi:MAG: hypothetical protein ABTQ27_11210 [Amaricoccus sp.]|uniref:hypothetical protein n=1 Tax=Amaricoccus sp. TaxID=1872485 RepID=UPI003315EB6F
MGILLGFLPFLTVAVLNPTLGPAIGLPAGALVAGLLLLRDRRAGRESSFIEFGSFVLFAGLAGWLAISGGDLSLFTVKLVVDAGLFVIVLASMAAGRPFTLTYARRQAPERLWNDPRFLRVNQAISGVWALAFLVMALAEAAVVLLPGVPASLGVLAPLAALAAAIAFTRWYPSHVRARSS